MSFFPQGIARVGLAPFRAQVLAALCMLTAVGALAQRPADTNAGEIALLPKYCPDTMGFSYGDASFNTSPRASHWLGLMGKSFWAMHHYCWGLIKYRRATSGVLPAQARLGYLLSANNEWDYVIQHSTADFIMLPDVYLRRGETHVQLKNYGLAAAAFAESRKRKPDYPPPYLRWAEVLVMIGNKKEALAHLELGLRHAPSSPELAAQYKRLGGNPEAFIRTLPAVAAPAPAAPASATETTGTAGPTQSAAASSAVPAATAASGATSP